MLPDGRGAEPCSWRHWLFGRRRGGIAYELRTSREKDSANNVLADQPSSVARTRNISMIWPSPSVLSICQVGSLP